MKKYFFIFAAAMLSLAACNKEIAEAVVENDNDVVLTFTSERPQLDDFDTRTAWDATTSSIIWQSTDKIKVGFTFNDAWWAQTAAYASTNETPNNHIKFYQSDEVEIDSESSSIGTFVVPTTSGKFTGPSTLGDFVFYAVYPAALVDNSLDTAPSATVTLKSSQTPAENSFDATTDIMVGKTATVSSTGLPTAPIDLTWTRIVGHAALTFSNMAFDGTETPSKITLTFNDDAKVAGSFTVNMADGTFGAGSANEIVLEGSGLVVDGSNITTWATVLPVSFTSLNVEIKTDKATYTREITGLNMTFKQNARNRLTVNMTTANRAAAEQYDWVKKNLSAITSSDVFVIVGNNGKNYAMSNGNGTSSAPSAVEVTVTDNKLSAAPADNIQWTLSFADSKYTFYPNGTTDTWLYCTNTNNGVRVGTNDNKTFTLDNSGYLKHEGTSRFIGVYTSQDWRCYTAYTADNIKDQTFAFYVRTVPGETPTLQTPTLTFTEPTTTVNVGETVTNVATIDPSTLTVTYASSDEEVATVDENGTVTGVAVGSATITASFAGDDSYETVSANYEITVVDPNGNDGSAEKPYLASEAAALATGGSTAEVYVKGIISKIATAYSSEYGNVSFDISDDGLTSSNGQFRIFRAAASSADDFKVGDAVTFKGSLTLYNTTPELAQGNELISQLHVPAFSPDGALFTAETLVVEITADAGATIRYTVDGTDPTATSGSVYESAITITSTTTIKAIAIKEDVVTGIVSALFTKSNNTDVTYTLYSGDLTEGDYVVYYDGKAMKNTVSSNRLGYVDVTPSGKNILNPDASIVWHIAKSGDYWTIYNTAVSKYAAGNGTKNQAALSDSGTEDGSLWAVSGTTTYEFVNKLNDSNNVNKNLRNNGTYGFACYGTGTGGALSLYKLN